jgi:molybdopterin-containing oxidoreductase family membrane subunit
VIITFAGRPLSLDPRQVWRAIKADVAAMPRALKAWLIFLLALMAIGAIGAVRALFPGDKGIATTPTVEWGLLIVGYVFFAITTSGLCLASSLGTVFGIDRFRPLEKRHAVLAVLCLVTAFGVIALDLHFPVRLMFGVALNPAPTSPMWWMGVFYGAYLVSLLIEVWSIFWHHPRVHQWSCLSSSVIAIFAPLTLGAVFAVLESRAFWHGLFTPLHMIAAAYVSGVALLAIVFYAVGRLRLVGWERAASVAQPAVRLLLGLGLIVLAVVVARQLWAGATSTDAGLRAATNLLLTGPLAPEYVGLRLIGGITLPLLLIVVPQTRTPLGLGAAGALAMIGVFVDRLTFVIAGQAAPVTTVSGVVSAPVATYSPSLVEVAVVVGGIALVAFAYTLAERYLDLAESDGHTTMLPAWVFAGLALPGRVTRRALALVPPIRRSGRMREPVADDGPEDAPIDTPVKDSSD